jgi:hypothetical protein
MPRMSAMRLVPCVGCPASVKGELVLKRDLLWRTAPYRLS